MMNNEYELSIGMPFEPKESSPLIPKPIKGDDLLNSLPTYSNQSSEPSESAVAIQFPPIVRNSSSSNDHAINVNSQSRLLSWYVLFSSILIGLVLILQRNDQVELHKQIGDLAQSLSDLKFQYDTLASDFNRLQVDNSVLNVTIVAKANYLSSKLNQVNLTTGTQFDKLHKNIVQISNHSNFEVLEKLDVTRDRIQRELNMVTGKVTNQLESYAHNVTQLISATDHSIRNTQLLVDRKLNSTVDHMYTVASDASNRMQHVQINVTSQLAMMNTALAQTKQELNDVVAEAKETINTEVQGVKENIEMYVATTNKQFAAENDFVKYQLAGQSILRSFV